MTESDETADGPCENGSHCCCCGPGDVCCDCGEVMPQRAIPPPDWINAATCIENATIDYDGSLEDGDGTPIDTVVSSGDLGVLIGLAHYAVAMHAIDPSAAAPQCSCAEIYGEDPRCILHGAMTEWAKANPDICDLAERAAHPTFRDADRERAATAIRRIASAGLLASPNAPPGTSTDGERYGRTIDAVAEALGMRRAWE